MHKTAALPRSLSPCFGGAHIIETGAHGTSWAGGSTVFTQAEKRAEGQARAAAATEARQVREKALQMGQMRRAPKDVVMSEAQRRMVQSILREQGHDTGTTSAAGAASQSDEGRARSQNA